MESSVKSWVESCAKSCVAFWLESCESFCVESWVAFWLESRAKFLVAFLKSLEDSAEFRAFSL